MEPKKVILIGLVSFGVSYVVSYIMGKSIVRKLIK